MRRHPALLMVLALFAGCASAPSLAGFPHHTGLSAELPVLYSPAVSMETDRRVSPESGERYGATGLIRCAGTVGTGQLTLRNDVITTAAHVLIASGGQPRGACTFQAGGSAAPVTIDSQSIKAGSQSPLAEPATRDWAVARLTRPVANARPYGLAPAGAKPGGVLMVAGGNKEADRMGAERCNARGTLTSSSDGVREIAIDCSAAPGSSGAALTAAHRIVGIHVGYRSTDPSRPQAFSATHYNFAITVDGPFRRAVLAAAH